MRRLSGRSTQLGAPATRLENQMKGETMDLLTAIDTRSSAVRLAVPPPSKSDLERILHSGVRAPDHGRLAPARFVVPQTEGLELLGDAMAQAFKRKTLG